MKKIMIFGIIIIGLLLLCNFNNIFVVNVKAAPDKTAKAYIRSQSDGDLPEGNTNTFFDNLNVGNLIFLECKKHDDVPSYMNAKNPNDHVAIFAGINEDKTGAEKYEFWEAVPDEGVWKTNLKIIYSWADMSSVVYGRVGGGKGSSAVAWIRNRYNSKETVDNYQYWKILGARAHAGPVFDLRSKLWYCSELVWAAYYNNDIDIDFWDPWIGDPFKREAVSVNSILYDDDVTVYGDGLFLEIDGTEVKRGDTYKVEEGQKFTVTLKADVANSGLKSILMNGLIGFNGDKKEAKANIANRCCKVSFTAPEVDTNTVYAIPITAVRNEEWYPDDGEVLCDYEDFRATILVNNTDASCFLADTKIEMADDSIKNIQDIQIGDLVKSYDEKTQEYKPGRVNNVFHHTPEEMTDYYLILNNDLKVTPNHPVYLNGKWVTAGELKVGDFFGKEITSIKRIYERVPTYNFEVKGTHTYKIIWDNTNSIVHNQNDPNREFKPGPAIITGDKSGGDNDDREDEPDDNGVYSNINNENSLTNSFTGALQIFFNNDNTGVGGLQTTSPVFSFIQTFTVSYTHLTLPTN